MKYKIVTFKKKQFLSVSVSFFSFFILNLPSIKSVFKVYFTISSPLFNLCALIGLYIAGFLNYTYKDRLKTVFTSIELSRQKIDFIFLWLSFYAILMASGLWNDYIAILNLEQALQYLSVFLFVLGLIFFTQKEHIPVIIFLQISWGTILSLMVINIDGILQGRNYAPLSMPLGASLVCCFAFMLINKSNLTSKITCTSLFLLNLRVLLSWPGRGAIVFPIIIILGYIIFVSTKKILYLIILNKQIKKIVILKSISILLFLVLGVFYLLNNFSSQLLESRLTRLFTNLSEEPRITIYKNIFQVILDKPLFGYGLHIYQAIFNSKPHNIFLEVWFSVGIIGLIILSIILVQFICKAMTIIICTDNSFALAFSLYAIFYLLMWNVSGELKDSYMVFGAISIHISNRYSICKIENDAFYRKSK